MPRPLQWLVSGQVVTRADIRQWVQSVGARVSPSKHWQYVREFGVIEKIAREKAAGSFEKTILTAADMAGVRVRKPRRPGALARFRVLQASNDPRF